MTSTTSLVSAASSSGSFKPYICAQPSPHTHASKYKPRIHCSSARSPFRKLSQLRTSKRTTPTLEDREIAVQKHRTELERREERLRVREERVESREWRLKAGFFELAQAKVREACDAAAKREGGGVREDWCRSWKWAWRRKASSGKGWAKWEEGRFGQGVSSA